MMNSEGSVSSFSILAGDHFKPILWKADFDMEFSSECLYCGREELRGYHVEDERGIAGRVAVCPSCFKVNATY